MPQRRNSVSNTHPVGNRNLLFGVLAVGVVLTVIVPRLPLNTQSLDLIKWIWSQLFALLMGVNIGRNHR